MEEQLLTGHLSGVGWRHTQNMVMARLRETLREKLSLTVTKGPMWGSEPAEQGLSEGNEHHDQRRYLVQAIKKNLLIDFLRE